MPRGSSSVAGLDSRDGLGIVEDPEASLRLIELARHRHVMRRRKDSFGRWVAIVEETLQLEEASKMPLLAGETAPRFRHELLSLLCASELAGCKISRALRNKLTQLTSSIPEAQAHAIRREFKADWETQERE